jgi:hypothetical protein
VANLRPLALSRDGAALVVQLAPADAGALQLGQRVQLLDDGRPVLEGTVAYLAPGLGAMRLDDVTRLP